MMIIHTKEGHLLRVKLNDTWKTKAIDLLFKKQTIKDPIKKIFTFKKEIILAAIESGKINIMNLSNQTIIFSLGISEALPKDVAVFANCYVFAIVGDHILVWKYYTESKWKIFAKIKLKDFFENLFILEKSNLMLTTTFGRQKLKLWSFIDEKILFCGQTVLKEEVAAIGIEKKSDFFAIGAPSGKIYLYNNEGIFFNTLKHSSKLKRNLNTTKTFPLDFFDKNVLFSGGNNQQLYKWDTRIGKTVASWNGHTGKIEHIISAKNYDNFDSSYIVTSDNRGIIKKWDVRNEKEFLTLKISDENISTILIN